MADDPTHTYLRESLDVIVRCGYGSEADAMEQFLEQARDELDAWEDEAALAPWRAEAEQAFAQQREREASWTGESHNDRIDRAFAALSERGIVALQGAGYTMSDGWSDVRDARDDHPQAFAATFFHRQDVERAVDGGGLLLAFGAFADGDAHAQESLRAARIICDTLAEHGVSTSWDGSLNQRIAIDPFEWRRRRR